MSGRPIARRTRTPVAGRRTRQVKRASVGLSPLRAGAALAMLLAAAAIYGVGSSRAFDYVNVRIDGVRFTDRATVEAALADARGQNLFQLSTEPLEVAIEQLPTVKAAHVAVRLPGTLAVTIEERRPVLIWQVGATRYLADAAGSLFATLADATPPEAAGLPVVDDRRGSSSGLAVGKRLGAVDLDAATRLASLRPADVGSSSVSLAVVVTDENGFVVSTRPGGWSAVFGFYTPSLRTTELIPGQVRLLRSLLIGREPLVERVVLASETDGTYVPRPTPSAKPRPSTSAKPTVAP